VANLATNDSVKRCVLCDAPVGIKCGTGVNQFENEVHWLLGEPYCEYCGLDLCPFCGEEKTLSLEETSCKATDVSWYPMHYPQEEIDEANQIQIPNPKDQKNQNEK
jgi:hypothetical protein